METTIKTRKYLRAIEGKTWFVGDIHGEFSQLLEKLKQLNFDFDRDRLIATGDLIDHGKQSEKCLLLLKRAWFYSVIGNHETLLLHVVNSQDTNSPKNSAARLHQQNGGSWFYEADNGGSSTRQQRLAEVIIHHMPVTYEIEVTDAKIGVVHAASRADWRSFEEENVHMDLYRAEQYTWKRYEHGMPPKVNSINAVIMGHQNDKHPITIGNQLWIDTIKNTGTLTILSAEDVLELVKI